MSRLFYHTMQDNLGNLLFDVSGTMRLAGTGTVATIYGDEALTIPLPNPMTNHPSFGSFKCYLGAGAYDFYMAKAGYTFETLTGLQGWGTMALQNANAVAITGGTIAGVHRLWADGGGTDRINVVGRGFSCIDYTPPSNDPVGFTSAITDGANRYNLFINGAAPNFFAGKVEVGLPAAGANLVQIFYNKATTYGLALQAQTNDTGTGAAVNFLNTGGASVGSINTTAAATAYNTSSDARLKDDVTPLSGTLDVIRALTPVAFRWKADGSPGRGLLAQEVRDVIPDGVITGEKDAVDAEGNIQPMQIDYSKLVPYLIGAVKELTQQVEMLTAKLAGA